MQHSVCYSIIIVLFILLLFIWLNPKWHLTLFVVVFGGLLICLFIAATSSMLPNMWILVSNDLGVRNIDVFSSLDQHITVHCIINDHPQFITCFYANVLAFIRRWLWSELYYLAFLILHNWFVLGDFNSCFGAHEKLGRPHNARSC